MNKLKLLFSFLLVASIFLALQVAQGQQCGDLSLNGVDGSTSQERDPSITPTVSYQGETIDEIDDYIVLQGWCKDVTSDGIKEMAVFTFSGGASCCQGLYIYDGGNPPMKLLQFTSGKAAPPEPEQLDGREAHELVGFDDRLAYSLDLFGVETPFLPLVFSFKNGRYVEDTLSFPKILIEATKNKPLDRALLVTGVSSLLALGELSKLDSYIASAPLLFQTWIRDYLPELRLKLGDYGYGGWPSQAGLSDDASFEGLSGSFTAPKAQEYVAAVDRNSGSALMLFQKRGQTISASKPLFIADDVDSSFVWHPKYLVQRADGRNQVVIEHSHDQGITLSAYRISPTKAERLTFDPLAQFLDLLSEFSNVAKLREEVTADQELSAVQFFALNQRYQSLLSKAQRWQTSGPRFFDVKNLSEFEVLALEVKQESQNNLAIDAVVSIAMGESAKPKSRRVTLTAELVKGSNGWKMKRWTIQLRGKDSYICLPGQKDCS